MVFPAHDYKGETVSTIGEEKAFNPRLQVKSLDQYVTLMNGLNLPNPKMMDVAVPANMRVGFAQEAIAQRGWAVSAADAIKLVGRPDVALIDLREKSEREKHGVIPGSLHAPYPDLQDNIRPGGMLHELAAATGKRIAVLLRLRRTLGDGGAGRAGFRHRRRLPYPRRHRRLEEGRRRAGALAQGARRRRVGKGTGQRSALTKNADRVPCPPRGHCRPSLAMVGTALPFCSWRCPCALTAPLPTLRRRRQHRAIDRLHVGQQRGLEPAGMLRPADPLLILQRGLVLTAPQHVVGQQRHRPLGKFALRPRAR